MDMDIESKTLSFITAKCFLEQLKSRKLVSVPISTHFRITGTWGQTSIGHINHQVERQTKELMSWFMHATVIKLFCQWSWSQSTCSTPSAMLFCCCQRAAFVFFIVDRKTQAQAGCVHQFVKQSIYSMLLQPQILFALLGALNSKCDTQHRQRPWEEEQGIDSPPPTQTSLFPLKSPIWHLDHW